MIVVFALIAAAGPAPSTAQRANAKTYKYQTFTFPRPLEISDKQLIIEDMSTFVRNHSLLEGTVAPANGTKPALRIAAWYYDVHEPRPYNTKSMGLMKQSIYATQDRLKYLQGILTKYRDDRCFRAGFLFTKLDQLLQDMRRIYSYALKKNRRIYGTIIFFRHMAKKNIDVTYIVEFLYGFHERNKKILMQYHSAFENM